MTKLVIKERNKAENSDALRAKGSVPCVYYGRTTETTAGAVSLKDLSKALKETGESGMVVLETPKGEVQALVQEVQRDALSGNLIHVDFVIVDANREVTVSVPVVFTGVAPAVKNNLGTLVKVMHEIEISALPKNLPHEINVDISSLENVDSHIAAGAITLPAGVTLVTKESDIVASIAVQKEESEEAPTMSMDDIEISEKRGKKEEETAPEKE